MPELSAELKAKSLTEQGVAYFEQGHYDEAIATFQQAITLDPNYAPAHGYLGLTYYQQGRYDEAIAGFQQVIILDSKLTLAYFSLGLTYYQQGRYDEAIAAYQRAIALDPNYVPAHSVLGRTYTLQGRFDKAIAAFQQTIVLGPNDAFAHYDLGRLYFRQGRYDEAVAALRHAFPLAHQQGESELEIYVLRRLGLALLQGADAAGPGAAPLAEAAQSFEQALELSRQRQAAPLDVAPLHYHLGRCYARQGCWQAARQHLLAARQTFTEHKARPQLARTLLELGQLYHQQLDFDNALAHLKDALRLFKRLDHLEGQAAAQEALGNLLLQAGQVKEATVYLQTARQYYLENQHTERIEEVDELLDIAYEAQAQWVVQEAAP